MDVTLLLACIQTLTASAAHVRLLGRHSKLSGIFSDTVWSVAALHLNADVHYLETLFAKVWENALLHDTRSQGRGITTSEV